MTGVGTSAGQPPFDRKRLLSESKHHYNVQSSVSSTPSWQNTTIYTVWRLHHDEGNGGFGAGELNAGDQIDLDIIF